VATLQCSGNRRNELSATGRPIKGLEWDAGAISTAAWAGARLADVLAAAGLPDDAAAAAAGVAHIHFEGADSDGTSPGPGYAASIPAHTATDRRSDVLLAYEMNGAPLPPDHGAPVRALVPGVTAARSVKWLTRVLASPEECQSHWQQRDYRTFSPSTDWDNVSWDAAPSIQETNVTSAICDPLPGSKLEGPVDEIDVKGFAYSGGGHGIQRVDVSADGGATWVTAALAPAPRGEGASRGKNWAWTQWSASVPLPPGTTGPVRIVARAVDEACNVQPESAAAIWNLRGENERRGERGERGVVNGWMERDGEGGVVGRATAFSFDTQTQTNTHTRTGLVANHWSSTTVEVVEE
jgi:sulfite oxidase